MSHMEEKDIIDLIKSLKSLYENHYLMIIRYQKLFSKLKNSEYVNATDSFKIVRSGGNDLQILFTEFLQSQ